MFRKLTNGIKNKKAAKKFVTGYYEFAAQLHNNLKFIGPMAEGYGSCRVRISAEDPLASFDRLVDCKKSLDDASKRVNEMLVLVNGLSHSYSPSIVTCVRNEIGWIGLRLSQVNEWMGEVNKTAEKYHHATMILFVKEYKKMFETLECAFYSMNAFSNI